MCDKEDFAANHTIEKCRGMYDDQERADLFKETNQIYGLELLAVVQTSAGPSIDLAGKCATFYVGNNNARSALLRADSKALGISILAWIFRAICIKRNITPWFERVPGRINISDLPTCFAELPYRLRPFKEF